MAKLIPNPENRYKLFIKSLKLLPGDVFSDSLYGATVLLSSSEKDKSIVYLISGRFDERPDINKDNACIVIHEGADIDEALEPSSKGVEEKDENSFVLTHADKLRFASKKGSISMVSNKDFITLIKNKQTTVIGDDLEIEIKGDAKIKVRGNIDIQTSNNVELNCSEFTINSKKFNVNSDSILLGKNAIETFPFGRAFKTWLDLHTHVSSAPGSPTSPPVQKSMGYTKITKVK